MPEGFDADAFARTFGGARATAGGVEFSGDFDVGDIFSSLFGGGGGGGGRATQSWAAGCARARAVAPTSIGQLPVTLRGGGAGHQADDSHGQRRARSRSPSRPASRTAAACASRARGRRRRGKGGVPGDLYLDLDVRPDPHLRRAGDDIELDLPVTITEAVLGAKVEVPTVEGPVTLDHPARHVERRAGCGCAAAASNDARRHARRSDRRASRSWRRKIKPDDTETRKLFEGDQRTRDRRRTAGATILIYLSRRDRHHRMEVHE